MVNSQRKAKPASHRENDKEALVLFNKVCKVLATADLQLVEDRCGVTKTTMYNWINGDTYLPQLRTLTRVGEAIGFRFVAKQLKGFKAPKRLRLV